MSDLRIVLFGGPEAAVCSDAAKTVRYLFRRSTLYLLLFGFSLGTLGQSDPYPHNAVTCERCHNEPSKFGGSSVTVQRVGSLSTGGFAPTTEGGIHHRHGESAQSSNSLSQMSGERVSISLLGDGYIETIDGSDIERNAKQQRQGNLGIVGMVVIAPVLEARGSKTKMQVGRFGWKSQHASLMSSCADSLRNGAARLFHMDCQQNGENHQPTSDSDHEPETETRSHAQL